MSSYRPSCLLAISLLIWLVPYTAEASTVCKDGSCDYTTITEAINSTPGGTVLVKEGVYMESSIPALGNLGKASALISDNPKNPAGFIIDAGGLGPVIGVNGGSLIGFTLRNGHSGTHGGAITGSGTIRDCVFENNFANGAGGAIYNNVGGASMSITNTVFRNNTATSSGGAIFLAGGADLTIIGAHFLGNSAGIPGSTSVGGAVSLAGVSNTRIESSHFKNNKVRGQRASGGGLYLVQTGVVTLLDVTMNGNQAVGSNATGGGLSIGGGITTSISVNGGGFIGNRAIGDQTLLGGGIYIGNNLGQQKISLLGVVVSANDAFTGGGGIFCETSLDLAVLSGLVSGNTPNQLEGCSVCAPGQTRACDSGYPGICASGIQLCTSDEIWTECFYDGDPLGVPNLATAELACADGVDNDCDGDTDLADSQCSFVPGTSSETRQAANTEDPVNTFFGELFNSYPADINLSGPLPLVFSRYYASGLSASGVSGSLGENWRHNFEWTLTDSGTQIDIVDNQGRRIRFTDDQGAWKLADQQDVAYQLVSEGANFVLGHPTTHMIYVFNASGQLTGIQDLAGNSLTLSYAGNLLSEVADGLGRRLTFLYAGSLLSQVNHVDVAGAVLRNVAFTHNNNNLETVTDMRGKITTFSYDPGGLMTSTLRPRGNTPFSQTWTTDARVATQTDAEGNAHGFSYNDITGETTLTDPNTDVQVHEHAGFGGLIRMQDQTAMNADLGNDAQGRRGAIIDRLGNVSRFEYDSISGQVSRVIEADGTITRYGYTSLLVRGITFRLLASVFNPDGTLEQYDYDASGNLTGRRDRAGEQSVFSFNNRGQVLTSRNPANGQTVYTYNADGTRLTRTDPAGNTTSYGYDGLRRLNVITFADGAKQSFVYDNADHVTQVTDERGNSTNLVYDDNGMLSSRTDPLGGTTTITYDGLDEVVTINDRRGFDTSLTYDPLRRLATTTDPNGKVTRFDYDSRGRLTTITDGGNKLWTYEYDDEAVLSAAVDPLAHRTDLTTDSMGRITSVSNPLSQVSLIDYDTFGRPTTITNPESETGSPAMRPGDGSRRSIMKG